VILSGCEELRGPEEAADVIGAERRLVAQGHGGAKATPSMA
jgi:hypothetical protein